MPGSLYKSDDGLSDFNVRRRPLFDESHRHAGLYKKGDQLYIFYSRVGDEPERILCSVVDLSRDWQDWRASKPVEVIGVKMPWEGADKPIVPSYRGEVGLSVHQLRDPFIYEEEDQLYILYSGGGEQNIGIRKLYFNF